MCTLISSSQAAGVAAIKTAGEATARETMLEGGGFIQLFSRRPIPAAFPKDFENRDFGDDWVTREAENRKA
jgi:hypothetical protein